VLTSGNLQAEIEKFGGPMPPLGPDRNSEYVLRDDSGVYSGCRKSYSSNSLAGQYNIISELLTHHPLWGVVWRADVVALGTVSSPAEAQPPSFSRVLCWGGASFPYKYASHESVAHLITPLAELAKKIRVGAGEVGSDAKSVLAPPHCAPLLAPVNPIFEREVRQQMDPGIDADCRRRIPNNSPHSSEPEFITTLLTRDASFGLIWRADLRQRIPADLLQRIPAKVRQRLTAEVRQGLTASGGDRFAMRAVCWHAAGWPMILITPGTPTEPLIPLR
jgi:hypothetical protein